MTTYTFNKVENGWLLNINTEETDNYGGYNFKNYVFRNTDELLAELQVLLTR